AEKTRRGARPGDPRSSRQFWRHCQQSAPHATCGFDPGSHLFRNPLCIKIDERPGRTSRPIVDELTGASDGAGMTVEPVRYSHLDVVRELIFQTPKSDGLIRTTA